MQVVMQLDPGGAALAEQDAPLAARCRECKQVEALLVPRLALHEEPVRFGEPVDAREIVLACAELDRCRGARVEVGNRGTLEEILVGPAHENDGKLNLFGALQVSMATTGFSDVKEFQKAEVMIAPSVQTEGKSLQRSQRVGMG